MDYGIIQKEIIGVFERILESKWREPWEREVHLNEDLKFQDVDSLDMINAFLEVEDIFAEKYGLGLMLDNFYLLGQRKKCFQSGFLTINKLVEYTLSQVNSS